MNNPNYPLRVRKNRPPSVFSRRYVMEHKINKENIENNFVLYQPSKSICNQINTGQDLFFRNPSHKKEIRLFSISLKS